MSESLISRIPAGMLHEFSETSLLRGVDYFKKRRVELVQAKGAFLRALVRGSELYEVQIERLEDGAYSFFCTCPYFAGTDDGCKHIAAALIAAGEPSRFASHAPFSPPQRPSQAARVKPDAWQELLAAVTGAPEGPAREPETRTLVYRLDAPATRLGEQVRVEVWTLEPKKQGFRETGPLRLRRSEFRDLPDPVDRRLVALLSGSRPTSDYSHGNWGEINLSFDLEPELALEIAPALCASGRFALRRERGSPADEPLRWNPEPWRFELAVEPEGKGLLLGSRLVRGDLRRTVRDPILVTATLVVDGDEMSPFAQAQALPWLRWFRTNPKDHIAVPAAKVDAFLAEVLTAPGLPPLDLPAALEIETELGRPVPSLRIETSPPERGYSLPASCRVTARYGEDGVGRGDERSAFLVSTSGGRRLVRRDLAAEATHWQRLHELGFKPSPEFRRERDRLEIANRGLIDVVRVLIAEAWEIEIDGTRYRPAQAPKLRITSGIDWFEVSADDEASPGAVPFPALLRALQTGLPSVQLADGSIALLDAAWAERNRFWLAAGKREGEGLRFSAAQAALVEAWLSDEPEVDYDTAFGQLTERLESATGPADPPASFVGQLREYQREGLAWLEHLAAAGLGGCLADDMGLGKTVQLLAFLAGRPRDAKRGPSLVVAPKTLIGNWCAEAARFVPTLRVRAHAGSAREKTTAAFDDADLVVTSYDLMRRDLVLFGALRWDTCILDEAQAIKNPQTATAKAARQLSAGFRVAATGTPVENHLGELWSLFEFLNPGLLGRSLADSKNGGRDLSEQARERLARGLRPFLLRRTKAQVAPDLPAKTEQTVWCDLEPAQRRLYDELRNHYRTALNARVTRQGMKRSAIHVLEALLRLRQAACHPALLDRRRSIDGVPSAKFAELLPRLAELREEGHKALVFSQFTSLLALLRTELDREGVVYEYLDGHTEDRQARVERFQTDPDCPLFLISLKAGGYGLNLTAAEYVFLLDPWWNPAVEAQAIDRTHRIGQSRPVFAYRLIARGTVEERILELQAKKRELADAIFAADASPLAGLSREDLDLLLE